MQVIKLVVLGDRAADKNRLLYNYATNEINELIPNDLKYDNFKNLEVDGKPIALGIWHTNGQEDAVRLRHFSYPQTDAFLICYSVVNPISFENVRVKWYPEIRRYCPHSPIVLVGTQRELRDDLETLVKMSENKQSPITHAEGQAMATQIGAANFIECSVFNLQELNKVFEEAVRSSLYQQNKPKKKKCFLCKIS